MLYLIWQVWKIGNVFKFPDNLKGTESTSSVDIQQSEKKMLNFGLTFNKIIKKTDNLCCAHIHTCKVRHAMVVFLYMKISNSSDSLSV